MCLITPDQTRIASARASVTAHASSEKRERAVGELARSAFVGSDIRNLLSDPVEFVANGKIYARSRTVRQAESWRAMERSLAPEFWAARASERPRSRIDGASISGAVSSSPSVVDHSRCSGVEALETITAGKSGGRPALKNSCRRRLRL